METVSAIEVVAPAATIDDLDARLAEQAFAGTSFSPERRGVQYRQDYVNTYNAVRDTLWPLATTDELRATLADELGRFKGGLIERYRAYFASHSRCMSSMIVGPARFPVDRQRKLSDWADAKGREIAEFRDRALKAIKQKIAPESSGIIHSDQDNAVELLQEKIAQAKRLQEAMRAGNKIVRSSKLTREEKIEQLKAVGLREETAIAALENVPGHGMGFPGFAMQNNLANIKRMEGRVVQLQRMQTSEARTATFAGGVVRENKEAVRVQIVYDGKPDSSVRDTLKRAGFRWSPREGAWQRLANEAGWRRALEITGAAQVVAA